MTNPGQTHPAHIYKVLPHALWREGEKTGIVPFMPVDEADGFMHFSTAAQLGETLRRHFAGQSDLMLLTVKLEPLSANIKWEASRGGDLFPHLYGALPVSAVASAEPISVAADGACDLPDLS